MKQCTVCKERKTDDHYFIVSRAQPHRLRPRCKECRAQDSKTIYEDRKKNGLLTPPTTWTERKSFYKKYHALERLYDDLWVGDGCHEYDGGQRLKYGHRHVPLGLTKVLAHRLAWELALGPIPDGMKVCHHCDNPPCIRLDHLFIGTQQDNIRDMERKGRRSALKGEDAGAAKLSTEDVINIRASVGVPIQSLADMYGVTRGSIWRIRSGNGWKHLLPPREAV